MYYAVAANYAYALADENEDNRKYVFVKECNDQNNVYTGCGKCLPAQIKTLVSAIKSLIDKFI